MMLASWPRKMANPRAPPASLVQTMGWGLAGSLPLAAMWQQQGVLYEVVAFSSMAPDPVTGNFVGEIRLGYERRGNEIRPIRGGSLSGNLFGDLATARYSQETGFYGDYQGPRAVFFPALTVSGE